MEGLTLGRIKASTREGRTLGEEGFDLAIEMATLGMWGKKRTSCSTSVDEHNRFEGRRPVSSEI